MWKYCLCTLFAIGILVLLYRSFYALDGFESDPLAGRTPCDPTCSGFGHSKVSGRPCCHDPVGQVNPTSQADCPNGTTFDPVRKYCSVCTKLPDGTTQCRSQGAYDVKPTFVQGSINPDTVKTDVLVNPANIDYPDWVDDPTTNSDLLRPGASSSFLSSHYLGGPTKLITESDGDKPYDTLEDDYSNLIDERNFTYDYDDDETNEEAYNKLRNSRKTVNELIDDARERAAYKHYMIYGRYMDRPSDMDYNDDGVEYYYDDEAEGFASRL